MNQTPINLAVLVSGSGTTLQNFIDQIAAGQLHARVGLVVASRPGIGAITRAESAGLPCITIDRRNFTDAASFSGEVFAACDAIGAELICLAGWLSLLEIPARFAGRMLNIHPALLPSFGGRGMYGHHVHQAVLDHGCKVSGCTVHFVDERYDAGPIVLQRTCQVAEGDTPASLARRVFEEEKIAYPLAIELFRQGRLRIDGRLVHVLDHAGATNK